MPQNRAVGAQFRFQADLSVKKRSVRLGWDMGGTPLVEKIR